MTEPPVNVDAEQLRELLARFAGFEDRLTELELELDQLRRLVVEKEPERAPAIRATPPPAPVEERAPAVPPPPAVPPGPAVPPPPAVQEHPPPPPAPVPAAPPGWAQSPTPKPKPKPTAPPAPPPPPAEPPWWSGLSLADLFTAKVLAWAGGVVTLLGVLFFFVLAVNRGWIGPVARVSLGAIASALVFSAGLYVRRRYGHLYYSAYAAVGAGLGGGYATLLAAKLRYDLISDWGALLVAAAIAAVGVATALAWSSELIAGLGLIGATVAPAAVALQSGEASAAGTAFAALMFAGTAIVAIRERWQILLAVGVAATLPQGAVLLAQADVETWGVVAVVAVLWCFYLASAVGLQIRFDTPDLASVPTSLILLGAVFAGSATAVQFAGRDRGWALLVVAALYGALAAALFPRRLQRDLSALLGVVGLGLTAFALAELVSGPALSIAWAVEAAALAWLARRINDLRYQAASLAYLAAAVVHTILIDTPVHRFYDASQHPAKGGLALVGIAIGGAVVAYYCRPWESVRPSAGVLARIQPILDELRLRQPLLRTLTGWTAALAAFVAVSLGVLGLAEWIADDDVHAAFEWGHVAVVALWGTVALAVLAAGIRWSWPQLRAGALVWFGALVVQVGFYVSSFDAEPRGIALLIAAASLLAGALLDRSWKSEATEPTDADVLPALGIAAAGLTIAAFGLADLLSGPALAIGWAAGATALAWLARRADQMRYQFGAFVYLAAALVHALAFDAPVSQMYEASPRPAEGVVAFVGVALSSAVVASLCRPWSKRRSPEALTEVEPYVELFRVGQPLWRSIIGWLSGLAALYAASLGILGLAEWISDAGVDTVFQWGQVAVVTLWSAVALALLWAGRRWSFGQLRVGGLAWLGVTLAHALGYFPGNLDGNARHIGFLVVAAALLAGSLFDRLHRPDRRAFPVLAVYVLFSLGLALGAAGSLVGEGTTRALVHVAITAFYCALSAAVFTRDRDLSTLLWAPALLAAVGATAELLSGAWLVLVWAAVATAIVVVADRAGERRLQVAAFGYLVLAAGHALVLDGPPNDFLESNAHPAAGVPSLLFAAVAAAAFAWGCNRAVIEPPDESSGLQAALVRREPLWTRISVVAATVLLMYSVSLSILELAEEIGSGSVATRFHAGHSGASAMWGLVGLVALYLGLRRRIVWLQAVGFGLFGLSLAKIFLYDLRFLSSVTRALSFLAVGAVLLLGGFFVQRLSERPQEPSTP